MFSVFTEEAYYMLKSIDVRQYKIASRTVKDNLFFVNKIVDEGKPTFISLGMWDKKDPPIVGASNIQYMWCKSKYPCTPWDMTDMPKNFSDSIYAGYSDHTIGIDTCLMAIDRGATVIEKHFTLDKSDQTIRDHCLSATPDEFKLLCELGMEIFRKIQIGV